MLNKYAVRAAVLHFSKGGYRKILQKNAFLFGNVPQMPVPLPRFWKARYLSSDGRAMDWKSMCPQFDSGRYHHKRVWKKFCKLFKHIFRYVFKRSAVLCIHANIVPCLKGCHGKWNILSYQCYFPWIWENAGIFSLIWIPDALKVHLKSLTQVVGHSPFLPQNGSLLHPYLLKGTPLRQANSIPHSDRPWIN